MATGPIETHLHRSFNWENGAPGAREGTRGRSASCGNGLFAQCVRLRSEINLVSNGLVLQPSRATLYERVPARIRWCDRVLPRSPQVVFVAEIGHGRKGPVSVGIRAPCYLNGHEGVLRGVPGCRHPHAAPFAVRKYTSTANFIPLVGMRTLSLRIGRTLNVVFRAKPRIGCRS